ncbi:GNAT family N-acetyltransferase [Phenylobacterium sp.]|uniref:GNAT family N-acetyltransferase n=1 Tax=Phenylobacterium sp. TaxID=1871053 RepID=UPI0025D4893E|nr:GNAT family N-acetyltransferase [Phenylobacterium sp.]
MSDHYAAPLRAVLPAHDARRLLELEAETRFVLKDGRIASEGPPDNAPGPLMYMAAGRAWIAATIDADITHRLNDLVSEEPALAPGRSPVAAERYVALLGAQAGHAGLSFLLPHATPLPHGSPTIASSTPAALELEARLARDGMPPDLLALNFRSVADLWPPYCLVIAEGRIAALAFTARLGAHGAELGLATLPAFRGRGLAAQAVSGWSALPDLRELTLFYSTSETNLASQRVAAKLGLPFIGPTWEVSGS